MIVEDFGERYLLFDAGLSLAELNAIAINILLSLSRVTSVGQVAAAMSIAYNLSFEDILPDVQHAIANMV